MEDAQRNLKELELGRSSVPTYATLHSTEEPARTTKQATGILPISLRLVGTFEPHASDSLEIEHHVMIELDVAARKRSELFEAI